jgi:hypothetical protein
LRDQQEDDSPRNEEVYHEPVKGKFNLEGGTHGAMVQEAKKLMAADDDEEHHNAN